MRSGSSRRRYRTPSTWSARRWQLSRDPCEAAAARGRGEAEAVSVDIVMPRLSDSMEEGTILQWLKAPGDEVALGDELVEIETDKANMVYEAPAAGSLIEVLAKEGDTFAIGEVVTRRATQ